jgi:energy-coupling factor transporter ATP-binding protein EcfA2
MTYDNRRKWQLHAEAAEVFTPGAPVDHLTLFAGRMEQVKDVLNAVTYRGQHVILFGERGVGKTSLANVLQELFASRTMALEFVKVNCNTGDDFYELWRKVFRELGVTDPDEVPVTPEDVRFALRERQSESALVVIFDELDRLENEEVLSLLADTIKTLSDYSLPVTVVLVGVADSIDQLIADHASVSRALIQVQMPRMSEKELMEIIDNGCEQLRLSTESAARTRIARLSEGLPHYTHALSLHASQRTILDYRQEITWADVSAATRETVKKAEHTIQNVYRFATRSPHKGNLFPQVLLACALAPKDELGYFKASDVREPMSLIMGKKYDIPAFARHLSAFTNSDRGAVLQKSGTEYRYFYRFENPLLQPYVIMRGLAKNLISDELLRALQGPVE